MANLRAVLDFKPGDTIAYCSDDGRKASILITKIYMPEKGNTITIYMKNIDNNKEFKREGYELPSQYKHVIK